MLELWYWYNYVFKNGKTDGSKYECEPLEGTLSGSVLISLTPLVNIDGRKCHQEADSECVVIRSVMVYTTNNISEFLNFICVKTTNSNLSIIVITLYIIIIIPWPAPRHLL